MRICIIKLSAMGDIIHSMVVLQFIKQKISNCTIDWIVEDKFKSILEHNKDIDNILPVDLSSIKLNKKNIFKQIKIVKEYGKNNYDVVIDMQGLIKSAIVSKIVGSRIVGSFISGFDKDSIRESIASWFYDKKIYIGYDKNVIDRNVRLVSKSLDINITKDELLSKNPFLYSESKIKEEYNYEIVFVVGASTQNKIYPKERFLELAQRLDKDILVVWGNEEELDIAKWLQSNCEKIKVSLKGDLNDLKNIISNAKLVIGGDTGPTHIAWALNIPSITIFGNTPEYRNTYITDINKVIKSSSDVNPLKLDKNDFSIGEIKASEIEQIAKELLS